MHGGLEGRRPSHRALGSTGVAPRPPESDARTLRVGGWGGLRREDLRRSCTMSGEDAKGPSKNNLNNEPYEVQALTGHA
jgi:hypothetical protein